MPRSFDRKFYDDIVVLKTAVYTFFDPIACGILLSGLHDAEEERKLIADAYRLSMVVGHFFQAQDDYLDCFGDPLVTGKEGTDIADGKCTWLFIQAMEVLQGGIHSGKSGNGGEAGNYEDKRRALVSMYGHKGAVESVRQIYLELDLPRRYEEYETDFLASFRKELVDCHPSLAVVFTEILFAIRRRRA